MLPIEVIFRKYNDGEIIALFPTKPTTMGGKTSCQAYTHSNKYINADVSIMRVTSEASAEEYVNLLAEIVHEGFYPLKICKRVKEHMNDSRNKALTRTYEYAMTA